MAADVICVTGGTGFLGHHLVPRLLAEGYRLRLLVRRTSDVRWLPEQGVDPVLGDITDPESVRRAMDGCVYVVHAAALFRFWGPESDFQRVNVEGTRIVAREALQAGVRRLVHISAVAVVGEVPPGVVIDEQTPCHPCDPYQRTKYAAERLVLDMAARERLPVVVLRPGAIYGPHGRYAFNRLFIEDPWRGLHIQVEGGRRLTFPVFGPDVAEAVCLALQRGRLGEVYNICDHPVTHVHINHLVSRLAGMNPRRWNVPRQALIGLAALMECWASWSGREPFYPLNLRHYVFADWCVSSEKAVRELGFQPTPLEKGLRETIAWFRTLGFR